MWMFSVYVMIFNTQTLMMVLSLMTITPFPHTLAELALGTRPVLDQMFHETFPAAVIDTTPLSSSMLTPMTRLMMI